MKKLFVILFCLCIVSIGVCIGLKVYYDSTVEKGEEQFEAERDQLKVFVTDKPIDHIDEPAESNETDQVAQSEDTDTQTEAQAPVTSILDFAHLQQTNPDICAWIEIEGTKVDYPVLQSPDNDDKYLKTAYDGSRYIGGALFTQATYNSNDFNDPVTVIYGHTMASGTLFGQLQKIYTDSAKFAEHSEIKLYLPDGVRYYDVFAAVPFEPVHILHNYDFTVQYWYENFFGKVYDVRSLNATFNEEMKPQFGDRVLILSTCLNEDSSRRFLVMAVSRDDHADNNG